MKKLAQAKIYWLSTQEGGRNYLPTGLSYVTVAEFDGASEGQPSELWSVVVESNAPFKQNEWNIVTASFLNHENAPQHLLKLGRRFQLREGQPVVANGEITESAEVVHKRNGRAAALREQVATHLLT